MPLTIASVEPRHLTLAEARLGNTGNFTTLNNVLGVAWRFRTALMCDYAGFNTTASLLGFELYKPWKIPRGVGRSIEGVLFTTDPNLCEELVRNSDLVNPGNIMIEGANGPPANTALQFRFSFAVANGVCRKTGMPVAFGIYPGKDEQEWYRTLMFADSGRRDVIMLPWKVLLNIWNTEIGNTNWLTEFNPE